jgi:histidinol-phosphate aminotransferase
MENSPFEAEALLRAEVRDLPVYSPGVSPEEAALRWGIRECVKMASNENPLGPSPLAVEAIKKNLENINIYPDPQCLPLRKALAERTGIPSECIIVTHGADEAFDLLAYAFLDRGDEVVVGEPAFSSYELAAATMGARVVRVPLRNYRQDVPAMLEAVTSRTKMVFICSPLNPTGTTVGEGELEEALEAFSGRVLLVLDEAYVEYVTDPRHPDALRLFRRHPHLVVVRTFSKIYGLAGLRVGYAFCHPEVREALERVKLPFNVNRLGQAAALAALEDEDHVARSREMNERGKERIYALLQKYDLEYVPTQANFILVRNGRFGDLFQLLLRRGVIVRDGAALGLPGHVRITVGDDCQNERLERALEEIAAEVGVTPGKGDGGA